MTDRVVLAYSGGLDTSVAIGWIAAETGAEVIAVAADVGQGGEDLDVIRQRALAAARSRRWSSTPRTSTPSEYCLPALKANAPVHEPLSAGLGAVAAGDRASTWSRPRGTTMPRRSRTAAPERATTRCASRSGIGALAPDLSVIAPVRDSA